MKGMPQRFLDVTKTNSARPYHTGEQNESSIARRSARLWRGDELDNESGFIAHWYQDIQTGCFDLSRAKKIKADPVILGDADHQG